MREVKSKLNPYKDEIFKLYLEEGYSISKLAIKYNCSAWAVRNLLDANDIEIRTGSFYHRKYEINHNFLDEIDTQEKAYFLGFFYADGYNKSNGKGFTFMLGPTEQQILEDFNTILESDYPIHDNYAKDEKGEYQLRKVLDVSSEQLSKRLTELGAPTNKTLIIKFPNFLKEDLMQHFLRGYFDGDGSFSSKGFMGVQVEIISTIEFLTGLKKYLESHNIFPGNVLPKGNVGVLFIQSQSSVKAFMDFIYKDATIYLERKYEKYLDYYERGKSICTDKARTREEYNASRRKKNKKFNII